ncbi:MAG TPA: hypothetical protein VKV24_05835 [Casimicrobiaceae bacterium]|nr:hypothetical protein [Casimicrobiaceae bacterium]
MWLSVTAVQTQPNTYVRTLYLTHGPSFDSLPFDPAQVVRKAVGTATFSFANGNSGTFACEVDLGDGVNEASRKRARCSAHPGTVCQ